MTECQTGSDVSVQLRSQFESVMHIFPVFVPAWPFSAFDSLYSFMREICYPKILVFFFFFIIIIIIIIILDGNAVQSASLMDCSVSAVFF